MSHSQGDGFLSLQTSFGERNCESYLEARGAEGLIFYKLQLKQNQDHLSERGHRGGRRLLNEEEAEVPAVPWALWSPQRAATVLSARGDRGRAGLSCASDRLAPWPLRVSLCWLLGPSSTFKASPLHACLA